MDRITTPFDSDGISKVSETFGVCSRHGFKFTDSKIYMPFKTEQPEHAASGHNHSTMDTNTLIIILLVVLLLGGGGFYYRGRRRI
jgi:LPXTG-motif cell wall-anchored protein